MMKRFVKNALRDGVRRGISDAVGKAVQQVVEPRATEYANKAAEHFDRAAGNAAEQGRRTASGLEGAFANLERSMHSYATEMSRNMKICPNCEQPTTADKSFCPSCGAKLPEQSVAEGAVCSSCGTQNSIGMKFCTECGAKLPQTIREEQAALARDGEVMAKWDEWMWAYPKWSCGGSGFDIEAYEPGQFRFSASFEGDSFAAKNAVEQYRALLSEHGFRQAGQYPSKEHLYKMVDGVCHHVDTEHCFDGDPDCPCIYFAQQEPYGGFDYVKPEPKKKLGLGDILRF